MQRQLLEFRLAGVDKDDATRKKLNQLNDRLTDDQSKFDRNISDDARTVEVTDKSELEGLPKDFIDKQKRAANGNLLIPADEPNTFPVLELAKSDALRRRIWEAWNTRAYPQNRAVLLDMMQTRYQIANIIGYPSWADYNAADKMIGKGSNIAKFVGDLDAAARPIAQREFEMLLAEKRKTDPGATEILGYQYWYLQEHVRRSTIRFRFANRAPVFSLPAGEAGRDEHRGFAVSYQLPAGGECSCVGPVGRDLGCHRQRQSHWPVLSGHVSAAGQVQPCGNVTRPRRHPRQATPRRHSDLQFSSAYCEGPGADGLWRRVRPSFTNSGT